MASAILADVAPDIPPSKRAKAPLRLEGSRPSGENFPSAEGPAKLERSRNVARVSGRQAAAPQGGPGSPPRFSKLALTVRNRQRRLPIDAQFLRAMARGLFDQLPQVEAAELGVFLVAAPEMTCLNEQFLHHAGSTDVITFDYSDHASRITHHASCLHGEIFLCVDEAVRQARRFRTTWQSELVRYLIHGVLHLLGHDDQRPAARRKMKKEENRLLRELTLRFPLSRLAARRVNRKS